MSISLSKNLLVLYISQPLQAWSHSYNAGSYFDLNRSSAGNDFESCSLFYNKPKNKSTVLPIPRMALHTLSCRTMQSQIMAKFRLAPKATYLGPWQTVQSMQDSFCVQFLQNSETAKTYLSMH